MEHSEMKNPKQIAWDSSYSFGMTSGQKGERFLAYARNDKRATALTLMVGNVGEGKMPAFIGLPGAREKTEIGRGLFERSEFRSPVGERSER